MKTTIFALMALAATSAFAQDCCKNKVEAKQEKTSYASKPCGSKAMSAEQEFLMEAERMALSAEGKKMCCKSTEAKVLVKGAKGCCNATGEPAKFKVFVAGKGYKFFGCEGSAGKGRQEMLAMGEKVGNVQKVNSKASRM